MLERSSALGSGREVIASDIRRVGQEEAREDLHDIRSEAVRVKQKGVHFSALGTNQRAVRRAH